MELAAGQRQSPTSKRTPAAPLEGRRLAAARTAWMLVTIGLTVLTTVGFVRAFVNPQIIALPPLTDLFMALGLDFRLMMALALVTPFVMVVLISGFVFWRRSHDPMALLTTITLLALYTYSSRSLLTYQEIPVLRHSVSAVFAVSMVCLVLVLALFPDGRFVPRWTRWLAPVMGALFIVFPDAGRLLMGVLDGEIEVDGRARALFFSWSIVFLVALLAQIHRYRHFSGDVERQQTKWVVAPIGLLFAAFIVALIVPLVFPATSDRWVGSALLAIIPLGILLPVMVANAVLRYRLYEIDRVISRVVSYGLVMAVLGAGYATAVIGLGAVMSEATGQEGSDLAVAVSVLAIAALFRPVRARIHRVVDRRFNRTHYETRFIVERFTQALRDAARDETVRRYLITSVTVALQPEHVSVWLKRAADRELYSAPMGSDPGASRAPASPSAAGTDGRLPGGSRPAGSGTV